MTYNAIIKRDIEKHCLAYYENISYASADIFHVNNDRYFPINAIQTATKPVLTTLFTRKRLQGYLNVAKMSYQESISSNKQSFVAARFALNGNGMTALIGRRHSHAGLSLAGRVMTSRVLRCVSLRESQLTCVLGYGSCDYRYCDNVKDAIVLVAISFLDPTPCF